MCRWRSAGDVRPHQGRGTSGNDRSTNNQGISFQLLQAPPPWPDDPLADPWAAFYATAAAFVTGGQQLRAHEQRIDADLVAKVVPRGERAGELPPRGAFGDAHGRVGTTATATLTIAVRHHYVRLHLFE